MELKDTIELMQSEDYKDRFKAEYFQLKIRYDKLKAMLEKGVYFIDMKKCKKISKQFLSFLNMCLQRPQKIRPLTDELLFSEFITIDTDNFTYLTIDDYKNIEYPDDSYLQRDGMITMNIDDNRMINATFE